jgi:hypothetical protein
VLVGSVDAGQRLLWYAAARANLLAAGSVTSGAGGLNGQHEARVIRRLVPLTSGPASGLNPVTPSRSEPSYSYTE